MFGSVGTAHIVVYLVYVKSIQFFMEMQWQGRQFGDLRVGNHLARIARPRYYAAHGIVVKDPPKGKLHHAEFFG
jgi:hypothetical protein